MCACHIVGNLKAVELKSHTGTGQDFYSAHVMGGDPYVVGCTVEDDDSWGMHSFYYQNTISRLSTGLGGVGKHEAKMCHRRAYAGWVRPSISFLPCHGGDFILVHRVKLHGCSP
jgi:hypothetical protein